MNEALEYCSSQRDVGSNWDWQSCQECYLCQESKDYQVANVPGLVRPYCEVCNIQVMQIYLSLQTIRSCMRAFGEESWMTSTIS